MMIAKCREKKAIEAACNGHLDIFPEARVEFKNDWAYFIQNGKIVWNCSEDYARANFEIIDKGETNGID